MAKRRRKKLIRLPKFRRKAKSAKGYDEIGFFSKRKRSASQRRTASKRSSNIIKNRVIALLAAVAVFIFSSYLLISLSHPVGAVEYFKTIFSTSGSSGGYEIDIEGGKPQYTISGNDVYFIVTDSTVNCYNTDGKVIFEKNHSYSKPVVRKSETRYLFYDQGEPELTVATYSDNLYSAKFDHGIICADISDSGYFAVATKADGYDSSVSVFNKKNKKVFEWFSSDETITSVSLLKNGKTLAVSTVKVESGNFVSHVYIFKYDSATPIMQRAYSDKIVYQLVESKNSGFFAVLDNKIEFLNFKKETAITHESEYSVNLIKQFKDRTIALRSVAANQNHCVVEIFNRKGKLVSSFEVDNNITDFSYKSGRLYLLGQSNVYKYNIKGKLLEVADVNYDALFVEVISDSSVACIRSSVIEKCVLKKAED